MVRGLRCNGYLSFFSQCNRISKIYFQLDKKENTQQKRRTYFPFVINKKIHECRVFQRKIHQKINKRKYNVSSEGRWIWFVGHSFLVWKRVCLRFKLLILPWIRRLWFLGPMDQTLPCNRIQRNTWLGYWQIYQSQKSEHFSLPLNITKRNKNTLVLTFRLRGCSTHVCCLWFCISPHSELCCWWIAALCLVRRSQGEKNWFWYLVQDWSHTFKF